MTDAAPESRPNITVARLLRMKQQGERIVALTAYDASFASLLESAGVEVILVGDSLGNVIQGHDSTVPVTVEDMVYHTAAVSRGRRSALLIGDMPFLSYASQDQALRNAARLMQEGGARMVKLEGGAHLAEIFRALSRHGVPVCGHLGLLPQTVHKLSGYRVQGKGRKDADRMIEDGLRLQDAGMDLVVAECIPAELGARLAEALEIPVIGIGAGPGCDGQVLVLYDLLGVSSGVRPRFVKNFLLGRQGIQTAVQDYVEAVKNGSFPGPEHSF